MIEEEATALKLPGGRCLAPLLLPGLPSAVPFGVLGRLLGTTLPHRARLELHRLSRERALEILDRAGAVAEAELAAPSEGSSRDRPETERTAGSARELARAVAHREQDLWRAGVVLASAAPSLPRAERLREELARKLTALGFRVRIPRHATAEALAGPTGEGTERRPHGYWHTLHTDGVGALFPFVDESVVESGGVLLGLLLEDAAPVLLDRWAHASHSWGIFGTTGSGKTFAAALWATRSRWRSPDLELIVLDPLGEFTGWARALGGSVVDLGARATGRINPLDPATTGGDRSEKAGRAAGLIRSLFPSLRDEEAATLDRALHRLYSDGPEVPVFSDLRAELARHPDGAGRLVDLLGVFTEGSLRHLDGPTDVRLDGSPLVVTFTGVPEEQMPFHLGYVLESVYHRLRQGRGRHLVIVDEAHFLVRHAGTAEFLDGVVRHVRHFRSGLLLLSQHPQDFLRSAPGRSLLQNLRATLLLRLTAVPEEVRAFFQLTESEAEWLPRARLPREAGYAEGLLRFGGSHLPLAVVAATPEYEFLVGCLSGPDASARGSGDGSSRTAGLSHPERPLPVDEPRAPASGG